MSKIETAGELSIRLPFFIERQQNIYLHLQPERGRLVRPTTAKRVVGSLHYQ